MPAKISCVIVEDLAVAAEFLNRFCRQSELLDVKGVFPNTEAALRFLDQHQVDLLFLDVEMPGGTGFQLMDKLAFSPKVILTTSKTEYAYVAFQYNVTDFLKKPFTYKRFLEAIEKVQPKEASEVASAHPLFIKVDQKLVGLYNDDILFIESMGDYVKFVTNDKKLITLNTMKHLEQKLDPEVFIKVHRSYIVNASKISDLQGHTLLVNEHQVPISKAHRETLLHRLNIL